MRILMLGWELPPHNSGGLGIACYYMSQALALDGAKIEFVLPHAAKSSTIDFMDIYSADNTPVADDYLSDGYTGNIPLAQSKYNRFVRKHIKTHQPDVIHAHDWLTFDAGVAAKASSGAPLIAHVHATEFDRAGGGRGNPLIHDIEQHGLLMADRIIAVSHATKLLIVREYGIPPSKIEVVHNGVDRESLEAVQLDPGLYAYARAMQHEGYTIVSTLGRLTVQKGLEYFLTAAAQASALYDRFLFIVAGEGEQRHELIRRSAELGIADKVIFTGFVRGSAWRELYNLSDVFVMSSISEPFGLTAVEAAAHGTSIILTKQSGAGEVLHHVLKYEYWDTHRLADNLINIATSPALQASLSEGVKKEFAKISWNDVAAKCRLQYQRAGALHA